MKLSTRTRYGIRAILELAEHNGKRPLQLKVIAERQGISVKYLEQLVAVLRAGGFVRSVRGSKGGYLLARPANEIKVSDVFYALEGRVTTAECVEDEDYCDKVADCATRDIWARVHEAIDQVLSSVTLEDLVDRARKHGAIQYQI